MFSLKLDREFWNKYAFLALSAMAVLAAVILLLSATNFYIKDTQDRFQQLVGETPKAVWKEMLGAQMELLSLHRKHFASNKALGLAIRSNDRNAIRGNVLPALSALQALGLIADLQVVSTKGELLYSSHDRASEIPLLGDWEINRILIAGGVVSGEFYSAPSGNIRAIYGFPVWRNDGRVVAAVLFEKPIRSLINRFSGILNSPVILTKNDRLIYSTSLALSRELGSDFHPHSADRIEALGRIYLPSHFDVSEQGSQDHIGVFALSDQTSWYQSNINTFFYYIVGIVILLSAVFIAIYRLVVISEKRTNEDQRREIVELAKLNQERSQALADLELANRKMWREVGERKVAEEESQVLSRAIEQSPVSVVITDVKGDIQYVNSRFCLTTGYSRDEAIGQNPRILKSGKTLPEEYREMWNTIASGEEWRGEFQNKKKDGELYWELASISGLRNSEGKVVHYVAVKEDITEKKAVDERLKKEKEEQDKLIKKLEDAHNQLLQSEKMASIGQLAAGVAHEINNPVGFVSSNLGTLEDYLADILSLLQAYSDAETENGIDSASLDSIKVRKDEIDLDYLMGDIKDLMSESGDGLDRVKKIVQDLKDFSHADQGEWVYSDLHHGINSTLNVVWNEIKYKAEVIKDYGDLPNVECLPSQLNQVFMNILINAAHAIEKKGTITIRTRDEEGKICIDIEDTGKGIDEEKINRIFDPFFTTKPVGKGTGLGLSLAYGIIEKHQGNITVKSKVGVGTTFHIEIPKSHQQEENAAANG